MKTFIVNAFSLNMVSGDTMLQVSDVSPETIPETAVSAIGHKETAEVASEMLGRPIKAERVAISLETGDCVYVLTLFGQDGRPFRPPEGRVLSADELRQLKIAIRRVEVKASV
jgi:hypothetical protein